MQLLQSKSTRVARPFLATGGRIGNKDMDGYVMFSVQLHHFQGKPGCDRGDLNHRVLSNFLELSYSTSKFSLEVA